jgi:hypothetical protein
MTNPTRPGGDGFEAQVQAVAQAFVYPPTPNLAQRRSMPQAQKPRLAWALVIGVVVIGGLLAVPQVRAAVLEFLQIGGVQIFPTPPTLTPAAPPTLLPTLLDLDGRTTLAEAEAQASFPIPLPPEYGPPAYVFLQNFDGPFVILVWTDPGDPTRIALSLHAMMCNACVGKVQPTVLASTTVNGQPALWAEGPYLVRLHGNNLDIRYLVQGHVLIWADGPVTYRLETDLTMEEAVRVAEGLR